ncbi:hypothetical protein CBQ26_04715 [Deinococcus indicus]|uniref:Alpha/beta hydrolase n=1 Tax=Deinococcus indicus TaxID=223556 RepID=A0A246BQS1_9DEIO|nr:hypothetical protein [Deinococcus indicus]OWL97582.1 hypothetical protein CBQ26_04715 [Deinococcus indicus]GHG29206.1 hypothetical protein GCM10017784_22480 [Deinococcus indicus]
MRVPFHPLLPTNRSPSPARAAPLLALLLPALLGCAPRLSPQATRTPPLDPGGPAPDVVVLGVSGRCAPSCAAPRDNWDYLGSRGTLDALADVFTSRGLSVQARGYASHPASTFTPSALNIPQRGYAALQDDLNALKPWLSAPRPPRLVLVGHSQGAVWLHHLTRANPSVSFDVQVDLDSICLGWHGDFAGLLRAQPSEPSPLEACDVIRVAGRSLNIKDVVWPNVKLNLEVQSKRLPARSATTGFPVNYLFELTPNTRLDGTRTGLERFVSALEDHSAVSYPRSDAMGWVTRRLLDLTRDWVPAPLAPSLGDTPPRS